MIFKGNLMMDSSLRKSIKTSAGILLFRINTEVQFLLVHPGGPYWKGKEEHSWSIPKGEIESNEDAIEAAKRELQEETGAVCNGKLISIGSVQQSKKKIVYAWALEQDFDVSTLKSNTFEMEYPTGSGNMVEFPEIDKAEWFNYAMAKEKILKGQIGLIDNLVKVLENK